MKPTNNQYDKLDAIFGTHMDEVLSLKEEKLPVVVEEPLVPQIISTGDDIEDDMNDLLEVAFNIFITIFHPDKSQDSKDKFIEPNKFNDEELSIIEKKIGAKTNRLTIDADANFKPNVVYDSLKWIKENDLSSFDIIDLDSWGSPVKHLEVLSLIHI